MVAMADACQACKTCTTYRSRAAKHPHIKLDLIAILLTEALLQNTCPVAVRLLQQGTS